MRLRYHRRRLADFARCLPAARAGAERERWPRERLEAFQQERLDDLVRHAVARSRYYRERIARPAGPVALADLPTMDKAQMMESFDSIVCDPRLRRDELLAWVERLERDELWANRYRVMATSGSSGRKGLFAYDARGWAAVGGMFMRQSERFGLRPRLPRRRRMAIVTGSSFSHMSSQGGATLRVGIHRTLSLPMSMPLDRLVAALNDFRPEFMNVYPSIAARLAEEQEAGRLRLSLAGMSTSSELRTAALTRRLVDAFGVHPFDLYATTEGVWAAECERHDGLHLFEDTCLVENVDADGRPVPPGEPGAKILVTNLENRVQPIIRLEVSDVVEIDPEPCPCGRTLRRLRAIDGRSDDVVELPGRSGRRVKVLPIEFGLVARDRAVREFQVIQRGDALRVLVVPANGADPALDARVARALAARLGEMGVDHPAVTVERASELPRTAGGKLQIVVAERTAAGAA
jgi:phenylacetate-CoA ligase